VSPFGRWDFGVRRIGKQLMDPLQDGAQIAPRPVSSSSGTRLGTRRHADRPENYR